MNRPDRSSGFTLIEMLVVMGVIVLITYIALPSVSSYFQVSLNSAARDIATNVKEASNAALLTGRVYRIAYDLKESQFWVEAGPTELLLSTKESDIKDSQRKLFSSSASPNPSTSGGSFSMDKQITRKKVDLPRGITYTDIVTLQTPDPITTGIAYTHFFPHGLTEQTIIHLVDASQHEASLVILPMTGKIDFYGYYVKSDDIFGQ